MTAAAAPMPRAEAAALLAVDPAATPAEVQRAFLRAARRVHPDVLTGADEAERRRGAAEFDRLLRAREVLLAPEPRAAAVPDAHTTVRADPDGPRYRQVQGRGLGGSLVVLALLAFLLVLLVTVEQGVRDPFDPSPVGTPPAGATP